MDLPPIFLRYARLYAAHGHSLYLIGGTSRDLLLGEAPLDFDFTTDATVEEERAFLPPFNDRFARFGSIKLKEGDIEIDITTFRKEKGYADHRHPGEVLFVRDPETDSWRRDFTVNALYIDGNGDILDFHGGLEDLRLGLIRFIGDPDERVKEDPLRILRAERFARRLGFQIEEKTLEAIERNRSLLACLNPDKVNMERRKL